MGVQISRLEFRDFKQVREKIIRIEPGGHLVEFAGPTGSGKTTILEAAFAGMDGIDPLDIRPGADKAEVMLAMTDGTEIHRTRTRTKPTLDVRRGEAREEIKRPQEFLESLLGGAVIDPLELLDPKRLKTAILEAIGVRADPARVATGLKVRSEDLPNLDWSQPAPDVLARLRDHYAGQRTEAGRDARQKMAALADATKRLPAPTPELEIHADDLDREEARLRESIAAERVKVASIEGMKKRLAVVDENRRAAANRIAGLEDELTRLRASLASFEDESGHLREKISGTGPDQQAIAQAERDLQDVANDRAALREYAAAQAQRQAVDQMRAVADASQARLDDLDAKVKSAGTVLTDLVAEAGVVLPGLSWDADAQTFRVNDTPVEKLSSGEKIRLSIRIGRLRNPAFKFLGIDGIEKLDEDQLEALREECEEDDGWNYWTTRTARDVSVTGAEVEELRAVRS